MRTPEVTVFVCSYNKARYIEAALDSVRRQTFRDFELIVVDDCSTDASVGIIDAWITKTGFSCRFLRHEQNRGICRSLNEILGLSQGRFFAGLGADDVWHADMLERCVAGMRGLPGDVAVLYGDAEIIDEQGRLGPLRLIESTCRFTDMPEGRVFHTLLEANFLPALCAFSRLDCIRAVGGYDESLWFEDWDMWLRLADRYAFAFLPGALAQYRLVEDSMLRSEAWAPRLADSILEIQLKWVGRDELSNRILAAALGLNAEAEQAAQERRDAAEQAERLYADGSTASLSCALRKFRYQRDVFSFLLLASILLHVPYPAFRRVTNAAKALRSASRCWLARPEPLGGPAREDDPGATPGRPDGVARML
jgi:glycosyltransferase involved in cell wall biosynthesis